MYDKPVRIELTHSTAVEDLLEALAESECRATRAGERAIEVECPWDDEDAEEAEQAAMELTFFLKVWQRRNPHVRARLIR